MADSELGIIPGRGCAVARFADAVLRTLGGTRVTLRLSDPSTGDTASQLGLEAPRAEDIEIYPATVKPLTPTDGGRRRVEAVVSATSLRSIAKDYGVEDVPAWLLEMRGLVEGESVMRIATVTVEKLYGKECLYHLTATE